MDVREKLVELIESARYWGSNTSEEIADYIIASGVTVNRELPKSYLYFTGTGRENIFREAY